MKIFLFLILFFTTTVRATILAEFSSDGCTGSPNGYWEHCCYEHDFLYWKGGDFYDRKEADERLKWCMNKSRGPGHLYRDFVRSAGASHWSKAWPNGNRKNSLSADEKARIQREKELWASLGYHPDFDFVVRETILWKPLSEKQIRLVIKSFQNVINTQEYQEFIEDYRRATGEDPVTLDFHQ